MFLVDEHPGDTGQAAEGVQVALLLAIEHVDSVGAGVCDVHPSPRPVDIGVVETWLRTRWDRDEADSRETHVEALVP